MARCEDFPCCGHELGCCPDYDEDTGRQLNMVCVCGAKLPVNARFSICDGCLRDPDDEQFYDGGDGPEPRGCDEFDNPYEGDER